MTNDDYDDIDLTVSFKKISIFFSGQLSLNIFFSYVLDLVSLSISVQTFRAKLSKGVFFSPFRESVGDVIVNA